METILITAVINTIEHSNIITIDILNTFVQTNIESIDNKKIVIKIREPLIKILKKLIQYCTKKTIYENGKKVLYYIIILKTIYKIL